MKDEGKTLRRGRSQPDFIDYGNAHLTAGPVVSGKLRLQDSAGQRLLGCTFHQQLMRAGEGGHPAFQRLSKTWQVGRPLGRKAHHRLDHAEHIAHAMVQLVGEQSEHRFGPFVFGHVDDIADQLYRLAVLILHRTTGCLNPSFLATRRRDAAFEIPVTIFRDGAFLQLVDARPIRLHDMVQKQVVIPSVQAAGVTEDFVMDFVSYSRARVEIELPNSDLARPQH